MGETEYEDQANVGNDSLQCCPCCQRSGADVTGSGTSNTVPVFTGTSTVGNSPITVSGSNVGIGTTNPTAGTLEIAAPDQSVESSIAIRQSNSTGFGFDFALDQFVNGMGYIYAIAGSNRTTLEQLDRIHNYVGIGLTAPQAKFQVSDTAKLYSTFNNQFDSNMEILGNYAGKAVGQGPALGFISPANADGSNLWEMARILSSPDSANGSDASGRMYLQTRYFNSGGWYWNNNLVLTSNGNVGIGTTAPASLLSVGPSSQFQVNSSGGVTSGSIVSGGPVGIGVSPQYTLDVAGQIHASQPIYASGGVTFPDGSSLNSANTLCGGDFAEAVEAAGGKSQYEPGDVLVLTSGEDNDVQKSTEPYSTTVAGVFATKPGVVGRRQSLAKDADNLPMAMVGIVPTKVSAENGPIHKGDLLVSSSHPGYAMKGTDRSRMLGAVIGKAMGSLGSGTGVIQVLVTLQ
jgi:hypothetical protein